MKLDDPIFFLALIPFIFFDLFQKRRKVPGLFKYESFGRYQKCKDLHKAAAEDIMLSHGTLCDTCIFQAPIRLSRNRSVIPGT